MPAQLKVRLKEVSVLRDVRLERFHCILRGPTHLISVCFCLIGMILFCLLNPSRSTPYWKEYIRMRSNSQKFVDFVISRMEAEIPPECDPKYNSLQISYWERVFRAFRSCLKVQSADRPSLATIMTTLTSELPSNVFPLAIHQGSAFEKAQAQGNI